MNTKYKNTELKGLFIGLFLILLSCGFFTTPFLFELDMMRSGYATIVYGLFIFIFGMVTTCIYLYRVYVVSRILSGKGIIIHWHYSPTEYSAAVKSYFDQYKNSNLFWLKVVWGFFILIGGIFISIIFIEGDEESLIIFVQIMISVLALISLVAIGAPYIMRKIAVNSPAEAIIAKNGVLFLGQFNSWGNLLAIFDSCVIDKKGKYIKFTVRNFTKLGWFKYESQEVVIPIPQGKHDEAVKISETLK